jgi:hypothetical protein
MGYYKGGMGERRKLFAASVRAAHEAAYRAAHYRVFADPPFVLRVGERSAELDALLTSHAADTWAFVTACNPGSVPLSAEVNAERMSHLREVLGKFTIYPGESSDSTGEWVEPSVLVVGISRTEAVGVANTFGQNAILAGERGGAVELVWVIS